jgi:glutamate-1-semialdehyde 2,1-aminomutase
MSATSAFVGSSTKGQTDASSDLPEITNFAASKKLAVKSHALIPGGAHTYAKGDDQYPELSPGFIERGQGSHVWDVDGNEYIEYGMGLRSVTLGHAYAPVVEAAYRAMQQGINFTRPAPIEVECAEALLDFIPGAEMVKFGKNGSDVTTAAVKLARAYTGRDLVGMCAEHPFFSVDDWFIGASAMNAGIPQAVQDLSVSFHYNDIASVEALFDQYPGQIACLIMEPEKYSPPEPGFLQAVKHTCEKNGAVLIFDEIITGFRHHMNGVQGKYNVVPHLSTFGKAMGNGFSISALVGLRDIMELGGLQHNVERVFLLSTTFGAESHALAAALETMRIYREEDVVGYLNNQGQRLADGIRAAVADHGLDEYVEVVGFPCNLVYGTRDQNGEPSQFFRALFMQETIKRGLLMPSLIISYSHSDEDVDNTVAAIHESLYTYRRALDEGVDRYLVGGPTKPVFRRYN